MINQFSRTELLIGSEGLAKLKNSKVVVFGIGGVGGHAVETLVRSGVGAIDIVDNDVFSLTNINRQIFATHKTIGKNKVDVAKERLLEINPELKINVYNMFFTPENSSAIDFSKYDYIVDAIDTVTGKIELVVKAQATNTPIISSMGAGNKMNPTMFEVSDIYKTSVCPLAKVMRQELKKRRIKKLKVVYSKEESIRPVVSDELKASDPNKRNIAGSNAFVPSVVGLIIASEVVKDLIRS